MTTSTLRDLVVRAGELLRSDVSTFRSSQRHSSSWHDRCFNGAPVNPYGALTIPNTLEQVGEPYQKICCPKARREEAQLPARFKGLREVEGTGGARGLQIWRIDVVRGVTAETGPNGPS